ncbi:hypothetical protein [Legionella waltersii]|uniref:EPTP domain protein n=1 Tax=Legionella waltersii TaxID=66969 RepID=A0A0W1AM93_9GAMM|nr:hypothetical protein [Legionella waltersii]KTD82491.1 EPTP domain protein [Legionella waltersii]SNV02850.1 EPTP domain [Legionella waltersii]
MNSTKLLMVFILLNFFKELVAGQLLQPVEYLNTTGAREVTPFTLNNEHYLAVAQLAKDIPNTAPSMVGGDADVDVVIFKRENGAFVEHQRIPSHGNEGARFFSIGDQSYLAIASIHSGPKPPFNFKTYSMIYRWDGRYFYPIQQIYTYAAKQAYSFSIGKRHFLALANGVLPPNETKPTDETNSKIYEWDGQKFVLFQTISSSWGYSFKAFQIDDAFFLAFADNLNKSTLYRWEGNQFKSYQDFLGGGGRAFEFFTIQNEHYLAFANLLTDSVLYKWDGKQFQKEQVLEGAGGRNFTHFQYNNKHYLMRINFITGGRETPKTNLESPLYQWNNDKWVEVDTIPTFGGVSAHVFKMDNSLFLAVANSLSKDSRFKVNSVIYKVLDRQ